MYLGNNDPKQNPEPNSATNISSKNSGKAVFNTKNTLRSLVEKP